MQLGLSIRDPCLPLRTLNENTELIYKLENNELIYSLHFDVHSLGFQPHSTVETTLHSTTNSSITKILTVVVIQSLDALQSWAL